MIPNRSLLPVCLAFVAGWAALAGCQSEPQNGPPKANGSAANGSSAAPLPELKGEVTLEVASWDELQAKIAEQKGKVVVLDLWSNWCDPCLKEFPNLVTLQRKHPSDVACMSLNLNYTGGRDPSPTDEQKDDALTFLKEQGAKFPNFISSVPDEDLYALIDVTAVPAIFVYDRDGKLAKKFLVDEKEGDPTYQKHVVPFVEKLLAEGSP